MSTKDDRNKTGTIRRARDDKEKAKAEFWLEVREGGGRSPILEGDHLTFMSDKTIFRIVFERSQRPVCPTCGSDNPKLAQDEDRECAHSWHRNRLGFFASGELTSVFQPLEGLVGKFAKRPDAAATYAAKATGSH